jgi:hypothetical protein
VVGVSAGDRFGRESPGHRLAGFALDRSFRPGPLEFSSKLSSKLGPFGFGGSIRGEPVQSDSPPDSACPFAIDRIPPGRRPGIDRHLTPQAVPCQDSPIN